MILKYFKSSMIFFAIAQLSLVCSCSTSPEKPQIAISKDQKDLNKSKDEDKKDNEQQQYTSKTDIRSLTTGFNNVYGIYCNIYLTIENAKTQKQIERFENKIKEMEAALKTIENNDLSKKDSCCKEEIAEIYKAFSNASKKIIEKAKKQLQDKKQTIQTDKK